MKAFDRSAVEVRADHVVRLPSEQLPASVLRVLNLIEEGIEKRCVHSRRGQATKDVEVIFEMDSVVDARNYITQDITLKGVDA